MLISEITEAFEKNTLDDIAQTSFDKAIEKMYDTISDDSEGFKYTAYEVYNPEITEEFIADVNFYKHIVSELLPSNHYIIKILNELSDYFLNK